MSYKEEFSSDKGWSAADVNVRLNTNTGKKFTSFLRQSGVDTVIRYYASTPRPKTLTREEAIFLTQEGLAILPVFQDRNREIVDFSDESGTADARSAMAFADTVGQPRGEDSPIMFAVDADIPAGNIERIVDYFSAINSEVQGAFAIGAYGSGAVLLALLSKGLITLPWLSMSRGFLGTESFYYANRWLIRQIPPEVSHQASEIGYDRNIIRGSRAALKAFQVDTSGVGMLACDAGQVAVLNQFTQPGFTDTTTGVKLLVTTEGTRLRALPDGAVIDELTIGDLVYDQGPAATAGWRNVTVQNQTGVVFEKYLREPVRLEVERLLQCAISEWLRFDKGRADEKSAPYYAYVGEMWAAIGEPYDGRSQDQDGKDVPWSAAFISWVVRKAGPAYEGFQFSERHSVFVNNAIKARITGREDKPFWGYRIDEEKPALGDIIQRNREGNTYSYSYAENHLEYASHSDIVVEVTPDVVRVIGGNVKDTVTLGVSPQEYALDGKGFIKPDQKVIALLKNRAGLTATQ